MNDIFKAKCPQCEKQLQFRLTNIQAQIRCPACKHVFSYTAKQNEPSVSQIESDSSILTMEVTTRNGLKYILDKGASITPLVDPFNGILIGYWVGGSYDVNFTYNDLFKAFLKSQRNGVKVNESDEQGILDEKFEWEEHTEAGGSFYWLPSAVLARQRGH